MSWDERVPVRGRAWLGAAAVATAVMALIGWTFWQRWSFLGASPYPFGIDGYYYPIQLRSVLADGALFYPSAPLALWLMVPLAALSDPIAGAKLGAALGTSLIIAPMYGLGRLIGGSAIAGILSAVLVATSATSFYLCTEFVKSGVGLTVAALFLWSLARTLSEPSRVWATITLLSSIAVFLTHKLAVVLALSAAFPAALLVYRSGRLPGSRRTIAVAGAALLAGLLAAGVIAPERFPSPGDVRLLVDLFSGQWDWTLPVL
ncbi:MAG: glycosyltransferase family 39 protein, partial [Myxococcota bacterium]